MAIHNFSIIAHIDHGKSTLADRMLEKTGTVEPRQMKEQILDSMELEREKGITIKLQPVRLQWQDSILNLIDTPGHVDFQYEVSRSLQSVEGAILLVDATQGVQAQTIANLNIALEQKLVIIPVINKIDLPNANVDRVSKEITHLLGDDNVHIYHISAKTGEGVAELLSAIPKTIPAAAVAADQPAQALIFDSVYDDYKGVVAYVRIVTGTIKPQDGITFMGTSASDRVVEAGYFAPGWNPQTQLQAGDIGYVATGLKDVRQARVGDTITLSAEKTQLSPLPGFAIPQPKIFAGVYPASGEDYPDLRDAMEQLQLNDASLTAKSQRNEALGQGFHCGFLGMLHLEIVGERLRREYNLSLVVTTPSVSYRLTTVKEKEIEITTPAQFPDPSTIIGSQERYARLQVLSPTEYLGAVFKLMQEHSGQLQEQEHLDRDRVQLTYDMPLRELVVDLYDRLKSATAGYGSLSYELTDWRDADIVKLDILLNHEIVHALSSIVERSQAVAIGRRLTAKLKKVVPTQLYAVPVQAAVGGNILARETITARRKDVTGHLYGGDVTRKNKLLSKQKKGKKRLADTGTINIPPSAYLSVLKRD